MNKYLTEHIAKGQDITQIVSNMIDSVSILISITFVQTLMLLIGMSPTFYNRMGSKQNKVFFSLPYFNDYLNSN